MLICFKAKANNKRTSLRNPFILKIEEWQTRVIEFLFVSILFFFFFTRTAQYKLVFVLCRCGCVSGASRQRNRGARRDGQACDIADEFDGGNEETR